MPPKFLLNEKLNNPESNILGNLMTGNWIVTVCMWHANGHLIIT